MGVGRLEGSTGRELALRVGGCPQRQAARQAQEGQQVRYADPGNGKCTNQVCVPGLPGSAAVLVADDATIVGAWDEPLLVVPAGGFVIGIAVTVYGVWELLKEE